MRFSVTIATEAFKAFIDRIDGSPRNGSNFRDSVPHIKQYTSFCRMPPNTDVTIVEVPFLKKKQNRSPLLNKPTQIPSQERSTESGLCESTSSPSIHSRINLPFCSAQSTEHAITLHFLFNNPGKSTQVTLAALGRGLPHLSAAINTNTTGWLWL